MTARACIGLVILNWNGAADTIECLESALASQLGVDLEIVCCDNASEDDSMHRLVAWACRQSVDFALNPHAENLAKGEARVVGSGAIYRSGARDNRIRLTIVDTGANLGYAGGNNVGLNIILENAAVELIGILNNDVVLQPNALSEVFSRYREARSAGLYAVQVRYHFRPDMIQAWGGGRMSQLTGRCAHVGAGRSASCTPATAVVESRLHYPLGAAFFVSSEFVRAVGLLESRYFLYFEEIDWAVRGRSLGYSIVYVHDAIVYHKEGRALGSSHDRRRRSYHSERYMARSRVLFFRKFYPLRLGGVLLYTSFLVLRALVSRDLGRARAIVNGASDGLGARI